MDPRRLASLDLTLLARCARGTEEMRASAVLDTAWQQLDQAAQDRATDLLAEVVAAQGAVDRLSRIAPRRREGGMPPAMARLQRARLRLMGVLSGGVA
jgi:hypothetical protein